MTFKKPLNAMGGTQSRSSDLQFVPSSLMALEESLRALVCTSLKWAEWGPPPDEPHLPHPPQPTVGFCWWGGSGRVPGSFVVDTLSDCSFPERGYSH